MSSAPSSSRPGHQVHRAALAGSVERRAAVEPDLDGDEGDGIVLDQPCLDPAGGGHFLDVDGAGGAGQQQDCAGQQSKNAGDHWLTSSGRGGPGRSGRPRAARGLRYPVTELVSVNRRRASSITSSMVTAARTSGHVIHVFDGQAAGQRDPVAAGEALHVVFLEDLRRLDLELDALELGGVDAVLKELRDSPVEIGFGLLQRNAGDRHVHEVEAGGS
jgi:hypothetical protein